MHRPALYLALLPLVAVPAVGAFADPLADPPPAPPSDTSSAPSAAAPDESGAAAQSQGAPPPGEASATALELDGVVAVGETEAQAGPDSSSATGNAVAVGGEPLIDGTTGGSAESDGAESGALIDSGETELGRLAVAPWEAEASAADGSSSSSAAAALARLHLMDLLSVDVLQSDSEAQYTPAGSSGASSSDGAVLDLGDGQLVVRVLHAEASSADGASSYLIGINDEQIATSEQADGQCTVEVPSLVTLNCLTATGGGAGGELVAGADVVTAELADGQLPTATVVGTDSSGAVAGDDSGVLAEDAAATPDRDSDQAAVRASGVPSSADTLAFTGANSGPLAAAAALLVAAGAAFLRLGRREQLV